MTLSASLISAGAEDDAAIESLHDISRALAPHENTVVVGGQMVARELDTPRPRHPPEAREHALPDLTRPS